MANLKPQIPLMSDGDYIYPLTTIDQVLMANGERAPRRGFLMADNDGEEINLPVIKDIIDLFYPVGSIYLTVSNMSPATLFGGGTWEQIAQGRTLFGAGEGYTAGTTVEAGLPNIEGSLNYAVASTTVATGALSYGTVSDYGANMQISYDTKARQIMLNAENSNPIYGNSETVQPPAFVVYMWRRVA